MKRIVDLVGRMFGWLSKNEWIPILLVRICIGYFFFIDGKGKLTHLDKVTEYFESLGIPMPHLNALLTGATQCFGGIFLILGLGARIFAGMLAVVMLVAIKSAKMEEVKSVFDFVGLQEWAFFLFFVWIGFAGAGKASIDHLLAKRLRKE